MEFQDWLGTIATAAIVCGATLALGRWLRTQTADQFQAFKASVDQQFAVVDQRFAVVDQRFADMDRRFADIDKRFADIDKRLQANQEDHAAIRRGIQEAARQVVGLMDRRFEDMGKRFEDVGKRIDEMGKRMDEMGKRIDDLRSRVDSGGRAALGRGHA